MVIEGYENKFFHTHTSHRLRKQAIRTLEVDGVELSSHHDKPVALLNYYITLLGTSVPCAWSLGLEDYYPQPSVDRNLLSTDFTRQEVRDAFFSMNTNSSTGPDGFGPSFYRTF